MTSELNKPIRNTNIETLMEEEQRQHNKEEAEGEEEEGVEKIKEEEGEDYIPYQQIDGGQGEDEGGLFEEEGE